MRQTERLSIAVLLLCSVVWLVKHFSTLSSNLHPLSRWHNGVRLGYSRPIPTPTTPQDTSATRRKRPSITDLTPSRYRGAESSNNPEHPKIKITAIDRVIVVGKMQGEDTDWVINELPNWQSAIYAVDDPEAPLRVAKNKGKEANVYLQYIIDNYDDLPSTIVFLHSHRDGYPRAWHTEFSDHSNVRTVQMLRTDFIQRNGYANLRCNPNPGCPDEIRPFRGSSGEERLPEQAFPAVWETFFNNTNVPDVIATPCCAQFAVSRTQVLERPLSDYVRYHEWLMETELPDEVSGRVMEYMWHIIFGQDPV
ncbi:hypothetical protein BDV26DRAFT_277024 [Aspergillus bertholletiae]|uniref:DUF3431 domain containing protein n=1 Tax=Aspergillus bertholletiae TaxID=1226010 RepID=A0A5N7BPT0_9EURO|nr:hypothetical protein BDV26DRAFT_277024 [Aspergillus bertholletiae]